IFSDTENRYEINCLQQLLRRKSAQLQLLMYTNLAENLQKTGTPAFRVEEINPLSVSVNRI
ncbi:hypothetical protein, partial [Adlercreutzia sp. ZJ154]|uniref:hypothetical protein n=1 Tax=Adlercreutzia sp. ZJ154 TaxID=2709790 RepID=UPI0019819164